MWWPRGWTGAGCARGRAASRSGAPGAVAYGAGKTHGVVPTRTASSWMAEMSVTDQGIGIPERDRERIFERFYRVDPARSRATGGPGLGLAIVKHVRGANGGNVTVWSRENEGSTFTIRLPLRPRRGMPVRGTEQPSARTDQA